MTDGTTSVPGSTLQSVDVVLETLRAYLHQAAAYLPRLAVALVVVLIGWLLAKAVRYAVQQALHAINFHVLTERAGTDRFLEQAGMRGGTTALFGLIVFWMVLLATLILACNSLDLNFLAELLSRAMLFVTKLLGALLVVVFGSYCARYVGMSVEQYCTQRSISDGDILGRIARFLIMVFVVMIALGEIEIGGDIVQRTFLVILAGVVLALALAFGIGGKDWAADLLERWWPRRKKDAERR